MAPCLLAYIPDVVARFIPFMLGYLVYYWTWYNYSNSPQNSKRGRVSDYLEEPSLKLPAHLLSFRYMEQSIALGTVKAVAYSHTMRAHADRSWCAL